MWMLLLLLWADPTSFDNALRAGLEALRDNNLPVARARLEEASRIQPKNPNALLGLVRTYWRLGLSDLATSTAARAQAAAPDDPIVLHSLAFFYSETGDPAKAAPLEARYAATTSRDTDAFPRAIDLYLHAAQPKAAIDLAKEALAKDDRAALHGLLGSAYEMDNQPRLAIPEFQQAIRLDRYQESYYFDLGRLYLRHDNPAAASQVLEDGRRVFAKSPQLELALGVAYYSLRRFEDSADCFLRTIQFAPAVEQPYVFLGRMLDQSPGQLPQITSAFAAFVKSRPDSYLAQFLYARALSIQGEDPARIESLLRQSISLKDAYWESHYELGQLLERRKDFGAAAAEYRRAIELNAANPAAHYHLARVYERLGKHDEAAAEYAAHQRLSSEETSAIRRQESAVTYKDLK